MCTNIAENLQIETQSALNRGSYDIMLFKSQSCSDCKNLWLWKSLKILQESELFTLSKDQNSKKLKLIILENSVQWPFEAIHNLHLLRISFKICAVGR